MEKNKINILIVEDNPGDIRLVAEMLKESNRDAFSLISAGRIEHALKKLKETKFDIVLLDLNLPDSHGFEGLDKIARQNPAVPVIVLTGADDDNLGLQAIQRHASDYLAKGKTDTSLLVHGMRYAIERKRAEQELHRLNRTLKALSNSSQAMMRAKDESSYLNEVCQIIVKDCGHAMVWVGFAEEDKARSVRPVAHAGFEKGYLETLNITWADTERGHGPTGTAIRTGKAAVCRNMLADPNFEPWRNEAIKRGYASSVVLPLIADTKTFGAISIYSKEPDPFSKDEIKLLGELAEDLAYGIMAIRLRAAHQQAQDDLRRTRDYLEKLIDYANAPIVVWGPNFEITRFNHAFERLTGYSAGEVIGQRLEILFPENERTAAMEKILRTLLGEFLELIEIPILHRNGEVRHVLWNSANIIDSTGNNVVATIAQGTDITGHKRAEAREKEALAIAMAARTAMDTIQTMGEGVLLVDLNGHILSINPALEQLSGFSKNEVLGQPLIDLLLSMLEEKDKPMAMAVYHSALGGKNPKLKPLTLINKRGRFVPVIPSVSFIRAPDGKVTAIILTVRDISEIRAMQQNLEENNMRLRALAARLSSTEERERRRISAQIHDTVIQTLSLSNIKLGALRKALAAAGSKNIIAEVTAIRAIIEDAIRESRSLMAELTPPLLYELGLVPAINDLAQKLQKQHDTPIQVKDDEHSKPIDKAIQGILFQAIRELILNALKHAGKCAITVTVAHENDRLRICVEDNGSGFNVPEEGRFVFRSDGGFGLFAIRERLEGIGGSLAIRSQAGAGTSVSLFVPLKFKRPV